MTFEELLEKLRSQDLPHVHTQEMLLALAERIEMLEKALEATHKLIVSLCDEPTYPS